MNGTDWFKWLARLLVTVAIAWVGYATVFMHGMDTKLTLHTEYWERAETRDMSLPVLLYRIGELERQYRSMRQEIHVTEAGP